VPRRPSGLLRAARLRAGARSEGVAGSRRGEEFGTDRLIEVKTTGLGKYFPFNVTANEVRCSEAVFSFGPAPRLYMLPGALSGSCHLDPTQYRAFVQAARQQDSS